MIKKSTILLLALGTLIVFGGVGSILIPNVRDIELIDFFIGVERIWIQIFTGVIFGTITAMAGWQIVELPIMKKIKTFFGDMIQPLKLSYVQIVFISICAGVGEEIFFRGAIQPLLGIWLTSFLFVLLHGYLNPFNLPLTYYGIYMILVIGVLGLMTEHLGILTAVIAHTIIDVILLAKLSTASLHDEQ